ncbi:MAG: hypothetical protein E7812_08480 [Phenylobacterium sp.]|nr:MAG: hypothetical protein E7812_08480 [Phenylobacterium sp.]
MDRPPRRRRSRPVPATVRSPRPRRRPPARRDAGRERGLAPGPVSGSRLEAGVRPQARISK